MDKKKYNNPKRKPYKGRFIPNDPSKYKGNPRNIIYRSMWERHCMRYFDNNVNVLEWASEEVSIPYQSPLDGKVHRYYPDFLVKVKRGPDTQIIVIEVKPEKQTKPPKQGKRKTKGYLYEVKEWGKNNAKWHAAKDYCDKRGWEFSVWTERTLGLK
jgi:hypothetical protein